MEQKDCLCKVALKCKYGKQFDSYSACCCYIDFTKSTQRLEEIEAEMKTKAEPAGRLIDADLLLCQIKKNAFALKSEECSFKRLLRTVVEIIEEQPTVKEAKA